MSEPHGNGHLRATNASRWYGNVVAVNDISMELRPGITGLLGPNGAGKSTLLHMLCGLLRPSAGSVQLGGQPVWHNPSIYSQLGFVPEREKLYDFLTATQFVSLSAKMHGVPDMERAVSHALDQVGLQSAANRTLGTYSKGMRQRAKLAAALVHEPGILILDEPFNGLDPRQRLVMMNLLRAQAAAGRQILLSSHILEEVDRIADRVLLLIAGRLAAAGAAREIRQLMTEHPHTFSVRSSDDKRLAAALVAQGHLASVDFAERNMTLRVTEYGSFAAALPQLAREAGVVIYELIPADESLESVFAYLVTD